MYFFPYVRREWTVYRCPNGYEVASEMAHTIRLGDPSIRSSMGRTATRQDVPAT